MMSNLNRMESRFNWPVQLPVAMTLLFLGLAPQFFAQSVNMTDPDFDQANPLDCNVFDGGAGANFFDDGGTGNNYSSNFSDTIVFCPDLGSGSKVSITFGINTGFTWDVDGSDSLYVYDGPDATSPLLGVYNSVTDPNGFTHQASFVGNTSGCLTLVFVSDAAQEGTGWDAIVSCGNPPQPFDVHMQGFVNSLGGDTIAPADTGFIRLCAGDSILYIGSAVFPFSLENTGTGYSQTAANASYKWFFSNGQTVNGDSVWFTPPANAGYVVTLQVTDSFPSTEQLVSFIRVAPLIDFSATRAFNDSICEGDTVALIAGVTSTDTVGALPTIAETQVGGSFAGLTYLPDGSGINYETEIEISGFGAGQTMVSGNDLLQLSMTIEHSYLGDLEVMLTCPNGDSIIIFDAFTGQGIGPAFAAGFGGGGTFLGDAFDNNLQNPGIGWTYDFSDSLDTWGTMATEHGNGTFVNTTISAGQAMDTIGIYQPEQTYADLIGCPINGSWTLTVRDNLGDDDGYIFDWAIFFNPSVNPNFQSYTSTLLSAAWRNGLGDTIGLGDTVLQVAADSNGINYYNFQVMDDFGCVSDTTIEVFQTARTTPLTVDTGTCEDDLTLAVLGADSALWLGINDSGALSFSPNNTDTLITAATNASGGYNIEVTSFKNNCAFIDTVSLIYFADLAGNLIDDTLGCFPGFYDLVPNTDEQNAEYAWSPGASIQRVLTVTQSGTYFLTVTGCNTVVDSAVVNFHIAPTIQEGPIVCDSLDTLLLDRTPLAGLWTSWDTLSDFAFTLNPQSNFAVVNGNGRGFVALGYIDSLCGTTDTHFVQFEQVPKVRILDSVICAKDVPLDLETSFFPKNGLQFQWDDQSFDTARFVSAAGIYELTVTNICGSAFDSVHVRFRDCDFFIPNVITPNQDGLNDVFFIFNNEFYQSASLEIYNRWGTLIYSGSGKNAKWDGRNGAGELVNDGVYYFVAIVDGKESNGSITLYSD